MSNRPRLEKEKKEPKNSEKEKMTEDSQWRRRPRGLPEISGHSPVAVHQAFSSPLATFPALPCIAALPFCNFSPSVIFHRVDSVLSSGTLSRYIQAIVGVLGRGVRGGCICMEGACAIALPVPRSLSFPSTLHPGSLHSLLPLVP